MLQLTLKCKSVGFFEPCNSEVDDQWVNARYEFMKGRNHIFHGFIDSFFTILMGRRNRLHFIQKTDGGGEPE